MAGSKPTAVTDLAREIIKEFTVDGEVTQSKRKLAELLLYRHPEVYKDSDSARSAIKYVTGVHGTHAAKIEPFKLKIPLPEANDYSKVIVKEKRIGLLPDLHFPYYDKQATEAAINGLINWKPDCIVLTGDSLDCYHGSDFVKDPRMRDLAYEFDMVRSFINQLIETFPNTRIIYKMGNHEERYEKQIIQRVPQFVNLKWMTFEVGLHWEQNYKIEVVKNKRIIKAGHLNILHGHEFSKGFIAPVNVARGFYLKAKTNVIAGHHHRVSEHLETDINGKVIGAWSLGCLCELHPNYMPINCWQHGFATVEIDGDDFLVKNHKIVKGKIL